MDEDRLLAFFEALDRHHVDYVLVGGVAMNVVGLVRATEDIDVFVRTSPDNVSKLRNALHDVIDGPSIDDAARLSAAFALPSDESGEGG